MKLTKWLLLCVLFVMPLSMVMAQDGTTGTVNVGGNDELGAFLTDADGMTLYVFMNDEMGVSNCAGDCATAWPPLTVESADALVKGDAVPGVLGTIEREDGTIQVTVNDYPLYRWQDDAAPGDATGHGAGDVWFVASAGNLLVGGNDELGAFLTDGHGMTVYTFANDEMGVSNCNGDCAAAWPAVPADTAMLVNGWHVAGQIGSIEREDGTTQLTYNDYPVYYWQDDAAPGDALGQGLGDVWYVVTPEIVALGGNDEIGEFLTGPNGMTVYIFANDTAEESACYDDCATNWPPLTIDANTDLVAGAGIDGELGTIERTDGTLQVTFNGQPLYFFIQDEVPGDATGHNAGDVWFVAAP